MTATGGPGGEDSALDRRSGLPDALRVLLEDLPRESWHAHPEFGGLVRFWLERHLMFRDLTGRLRVDTEAAMDGRLSGPAHKARLARFGGLLVHELHGHHRIEDLHYFPRLGRAEPRLERGFSILDADHGAMDGLLDRLAGAANAVVADRAEPGRFLDELSVFDALLDRHLQDEEELVVPVILRHGLDNLG